jgi:hypothetical protein
MSCYFIACNYQADSCLSTNVGRLLNYLDLVTTIICSPRGLTTVPMAQLHLTKTQQIFSVRQPATREVWRNITDEILNPNIHRNRHEVRLGLFHCEIHSISRMRNVYLVGDSLGEIVAGSECDVESFRLKVGLDLCSYGTTSK